jgi:subtilisin family serine protease
VRREHIARLRLLAAAALALLVLGGTAGAAVDAGRPAGADGKPQAAPRSHVLTLITGDRVHIDVSADGLTAATVDPAPRGEDLPGPIFQTLEVDGDLFVIPSDAAPYLDTELDRELFNVTDLVDQGLSDRGAALPVIIDFERAPRTLPPGFERDRTLESIAAVAASQPRGQASEFGRAVARQAQEDARRGNSRAGKARDADHLFEGIDRIWLDERIEATLQDSVPQIGAPTAREAGFDGTGVTVAVLDTGIDASHPDLAGKVAASRNFTEAAPPPPFGSSASSDETDRHGHGTHVASTVAGSGAAAGGLRQGVAPGATLLNGKVLGDFGFGQVSWAIAGMEWAARDQGAEVVNMSFGTGPTDGTDPLSQAVESLTAEHGTLFVAAAGNFGRDETVGAPAAASAALAAGAVDKSDNLASFSSRGPRLGDSAIKPDVTAPGVDIVAARAQGTSRGTPVDEHYTAISGTSMATPHVAGAAALLAQRHPDWDAVELKTALVTTAAPGPYTVYQQGGGRIDVSRAFTQPTVLATPAPLDFGFFRWPHEGRGPVTKTVTYTNLSETDITLELTFDVTDEDGAPPEPGMITMSTPSVTVPAGGTATLDVTLDSTVGEPGLYGGSSRGTTRTKAWSYAPRWGSTKNRRCTT